MYFTKILILYTFISYLLLILCIVHFRNPYLGSLRQTVDSCIIGRVYVYRSLILNYLNNYLLIVYVYNVEYAVNVRDITICSQFDLAIMNFL